MSRSLVAQLEIALVRANKAEAENRDLKEILSTKRSYDPSPSRQAIRENQRIKAVEYCKTHNVKSVSKEDLDAWNMPY